MAHTRPDLSAKILETSEFLPAGPAGGTPADEANAELDVPPGINEALYQLVQRMPLTAEQHAQLLPYWQQYLHATALTGERQRAAAANAVAACSSNDASPTPLMALPSCLSRAAEVLELFICPCTFMSVFALPHRRHRLGRKVQPSLNS